MSLHSELIILNDTHPAGIGLATEIIVGSLAKALEVIKNKINSEAKIVIVLDEAVYLNWQEYISQSVSVGLARQVEFIVQAGGESSKSFSCLESLTTKLVHLGFARNDWLICIGGGVLGDLVGLLASIYMRGVKLIQIPTTLIAQSDSAIGGKTAVNITEAKNVIGTFYPAEFVISDTKFLTSLPEREYRAGIVEVIKHGLLVDRGFLDWIENNIEAVKSREALCLKEIVEFSSRTKLGFVVDDLEDRLGKRAMLNLGHTVAHALETITGYQRFLHGEAVACGIDFALRFGAERGDTPVSLLKRVESIFALLGIESRIPNDLLKPELGVQGLGCADVQRGQTITSEDIWTAALQSDKKRSSSVIKYVLLRQIGDAQLIDIEPRNLAQMILAIGKK
ncbi:MAG: 3-dehydroquinate synthase [Deltaproteobacteria bacterium]|nr:3-dehydroquinate synthase [Deltaproteobacteria bacterium]